MSELVTEEMVEAARAICCFDDHIPEGACVAEGHTLLACGADLDKARRALTAVAPLIAAREREASTAAVESLKVLNLNADKLVAGYNGVLDAAISAIRARSA